MCKAFSANVLPNRTVDWDVNIQSHSELAEKFGRNEDNVLKMEFNLEARQIHLDRGPFWWTPKKSHIDAAKRHFDKLYGTPERLMRTVSELSPEFKRWGDLSCLLQGEAQHKLPPCQRPCASRSRCRYPCPHRHRCRRLSHSEYISWAQEWKEKWLELFAEPENRIEIWRV